MGERRGSVSFLSPAGWLVWGEAASGGISGHQYQENDVLTGRAHSAMRRGRHIHADPGPVQFAIISGTGRGHDPDPASGYARASVASLAAFFPGVELGVDLGLNRVLKMSRERRGVRCSVDGNTAGQVSRHQCPETTVGEWRPPGPAGL